MKWDINFEFAQRDANSILRYALLLQQLDRIFIPQLSFCVDIEQYARKIIDNGIVIIARSRSTDIGQIGFYVNDRQQKCAYVTSIGVRTGYQGHGIGRQLLGKAEQYASERGMYCMGLEVHTENINAMKFYHSQGYTQIRAQKSRAGQYPVFYYEKQLAL